VAVLDFQVSLTAASLQSSSGTSVSLLPNGTPVVIDITDLQALSAFLASVNIPAGTYNSLSVTFANPDVVIYNISDKALGSACAVGTICQFAPTASASFTISSAPFPITLTGGSPLGLLMDFHLDKILKSDLTLDLAAEGGITLKELKHTDIQFGLLNGSVQSVDASQNQFTLKTRWGNTFTVDTTASGTSFVNFPSSACTTASLSCVQAGQIVGVQVTGVESNGSLDVSEVKYKATPGQLKVEGLIVGVTPASGSAQASIKVLVHDNMSGDDDSQGEQLEGGKATVTIASNATYSIDSGKFTLPAGMTFTGSSSLAVGQEVALTIATGSAVTSAATSNGNGWGSPATSTFTATSVELEPSHITGTISALASPDFTLTAGSNFFCWSMSGTSTQATVETTSQTDFDNFTTAGFAGLAVNNLVSVDGWLFAPSTSGGTTTTASPTVVAQAVALHADGDY